MQHTFAVWATQTNLACVRNHTMDGNSNHARIQKLACLRTLSRFWNVPKKCKVQITMGNRQQTTPHTPAHGPTQSKFHYTLEPTQEWNTDATMNATLLGHPNEPCVFAKSQWMGVHVGVETTHESNNLHVCGLFRGLGTCPKTAK